MEKQTMLMNFHCAGVISKEEMYVVNEDNEFVYLCDDEDGYDTVWQFNKKTGECINDNTMFGSKRTIDVK